MAIRIEKTTAPKEKVSADKLGFGKVFSDHMFMMEYEDGQWKDPRIVPFGNLSLHPASTVFHYGAEIFEGLKAYRRADGGVQLFRPEENIRRMNNSAERMCLPQIDEGLFMEALETLVRIDESWVPSAPGTALYIRPFIFGDEVSFSVLPAKHCTRRVLRMRPPFSMETRAVAPSADGIVMRAVSPTVYFSLSISMLSCVEPSEASVALAWLTSQSMEVAWPPRVSVTRM